MGQAAIAFPLITVHALITSNTKRKSLQDVLYAHVLFVLNYLNETCFYQTAFALPLGNLKVLLKKDLYIIKKQEIKIFIDIIALLKLLYKGLYGKKDYRII